ncbi:MAG TPA: hypothetical protein VM345_04705 [Acidimicrobiales bacterium]|nr:hypothetical protein [Acidimicrobiales bacterium]
MPENEIIGDPEAGEATADYVDPEGDDPEAIPDPMPDDLAAEPEPGEVVGDMEGEAPTG